MMMRMKINNSQLTDHIKVHGEQTHIPMPGNSPSLRCSDEMWFVNTLQ